MIPKALSKINLLKVKCTGISLLFRASIKHRARIVQDWFDPRSGSPTDYFVNKSKSQLCMNKKAL